MMFTPRRIFVWANFFLLIAYALVSFHPRIAYAYPYAAAVSYAAGNGPNSVFAADLDGDTDQDLAVANASDNNVSILLNSGSGTFAAAVNYAVGTIPASVFAADLDGDTDRDLAVANQISNNISILLNSGSGTFAAAVNYATGALPSSVFAADLDGDTDQDLAVANQSNDNVSILLNSGSGTFAAAVSYATGSTVNSVFAADLDGDTDRDLAVANYSSNNVSILLNSGSGTFAAAVNYAAGTNPASVFAADLNGNTVLDLAVANGFSDDVSILLSTSNPVPTTTSISPTSKTAGDAQFTLTVNGANFIASSVVRFNGSDRTTAYVSSTQLTATIPASDLTTAGTYNITVFNPTPGGGESGAQTLTVNNPVPTTTSISPTSKTAGDAQFTLTVNGANFIASSVVRFNGSDRTTAYVSSTQLTAIIPASDLTTAGTYNITVFNPTPGGGESGAQTLTVNNPVPTTTSISPTSKTAGDAQFTLTVNGANFIASSVVRFNGSDRTTAYVSSTQLTAIIPASDLTTAGTYNI